MNGNFSEPFLTYLTLSFVISIFTSKTSLKKKYRKPSNNICDTDTLDVLLDTNSRDLLKLVGQVKTDRFQHVSNKRIRNNNERVSCRWSSSHIILYVSTGVYVCTYVCVISACNDRHKRIHPPEELAFLSEITIVNTFVPRARLLNIIKPN